MYRQVPLFARHCVLGSRLSAFICPNSSNGCTRERSVRGACPGLCAHREGGAQTHAPGSGHFLALELTALGLGRAPRKGTPGSFRIRRVLGALSQHRGEYGARLDLAVNTVAGAERATPALPDAKELIKGVLWVRGNGGGGVSVSLL